MNRISLPKCHVLRASELLEAIVNEIQSDFEASKVNLETDLPQNLLCEADQDQFVNSVIYIADLIRKHAEQASENPTVWINAKQQDGLINIELKNNNLKLDSKSADAVSQSTTVDLYMDYDSNIGNCLTLSFPVTTPVETRIATTTVEEESLELAR